MGSLHGDTLNDCCSFVETFLAETFWLAIRECSWILEKQISTFNDPCANATRGTCIITVTARLFELAMNYFL